MRPRYKSYRNKLVFILTLALVFLSSYLFDTIIFKNAVIFYTTTLVIVNIGYSTFLSLRSDYLYNSRNADMQVLNFLREKRMDMAKDWLHFSVIFRLEARSRGYSGLLCVYSDIVLVVGLLVYLVTGMHDWYFYAFSVYLFFLSFIFLILDIKSRMTFLEGPPFIKRKLLKLPSRYDWIEVEIITNAELMRYYRELKIREGDDS